jgi:hypothetical protein
MTVSAVRPWRTALQREICLPASVLGAGALARIAAIGVDLAIRGHGERNSHLCCCAGLPAEGPLNLIGLPTPGPRLAVLTDNRLIPRRCIRVETSSAGKTRWGAERRLVRFAVRSLRSRLS